LQTGTIDLTQLTVSVLTNEIPTYNGYNGRCSQLLKMCDTDISQYGDTRAEG